MLTFGRMIRTTHPLSWDRRETSRGKFAAGFAIPAGTVALIITNLERIPMSHEERGIIRECARRHAAQGKPGVIAWLRDKPRFIEATDFEYVSDPSIQHHALEYE